MASADDNAPRRNRLSKPPTITSSMNLSSLNLLQSGNRTSTLFPLSTSTEDLEQRSPLSPHNNEPREVLETQVLSADSKDQTATINSWRGAAFNVRDVEQQHSNSSPPKPPISSALSGVFNPSRLSSVSCRGIEEAKERSTPKAGIRSVSVSQEDITAPIPIRRSSLCQPGVATRLKTEGRLGPSPPGEARVKADREHHLAPIFPEDGLGNELEALTLETVLGRKPVPPPLVRTETPSDLVFLGGLRLGSLHITNGRVSPAPSDLSRRARSSPNLRLASNESGDSNQEKVDLNLHDIKRNVCSIESNILESPSRFISPTPRYKSPLRFSSVDSVPKSKTARAVIIQTLQVHEESKILMTVNSSPNGSESMAKEYIAGLPASPFAVVRRDSTSESLLNPTTKRTEFDDNLFEDESGSPSDTESADNSTLDTCYSPNDVSAAANKPETSLWQSRPDCNQFDSGYGSNASLRGAQGQLPEKSVAEKFIDTPRAVTDAPQNELTIPKTRQDCRPAPRALRPSILKQAERRSPLPVFQNLLQSTSSLSTVITTASTTSMHKPRKLTKSRCFSRNAAREITVQSNHEIVVSSIPPVPPEFTANLAIRSRQFPELEHTYESRQYTFDSPTTSQIDPVDIRFPSPAQSIGKLDFDPTTPPHHRDSAILRPIKSGKRPSVRRSSHGMSEADALAIIHDFGTADHSLGGSPYDAARTHMLSNTDEGLEPMQKRSPHIITPAQRSRFVGGMDAETAAELGRRRSRNIHESELTNRIGKRNSFNDRGGLPGKNLRRTSFDPSTPPMPPLPGAFKNSHRRSWGPQTTRPELQPRRSWRPDYGQSIYSEIRVSPPVHDECSNNQSEVRMSNDYQGYLRRWEDSRTKHQAETEYRQSWRSDLFEIESDQRQDIGLNFGQTSADGRETWPQGYQDSSFIRQPGKGSRYEDVGSMPGGQVASRFHRCGQNQTLQELRPRRRPYSPVPMYLAPIEKEPDRWPAHAQASQARSQAGGALSYGHMWRPYEVESLYPEVPPRNPPLYQARRKIYAEPSDGHLTAHENKSFLLQDTCSSHQSRGHGRHTSTPLSQAKSYDRRLAESLPESLHPPHDARQASAISQFGRYS